MNPADGLLTRDGVVRVNRVALKVADGATWPFAVERAGEIDAHWAKRSAETPNFFNGVVHMTRNPVIAGGVFSGELIRSDFKSFLYWREMGHPDRTVGDAFGSALLRSAEGHVVLGKQLPGNINSGLSYLPGGFIDVRDVAADGTVDIDASILREVSEETGLGLDDIERVPGYLIAVAGAAISIAAEFRSRLAAEEMRAKIRAFIALGAEPELEDAVIVRSRADVASLATAPYARVLLASPEIFAD